MMKLVTSILASILMLAAFQLNAAEGVSRSNFTTAIDNREPVDAVSDVSNEADKIYYFTEIKGLKGQTITHRWEQNGEVQANVTFNIGGDRWRIWSSKNLMPEMSGTWQVMVVDEANNVLSQDTFNYGESTSMATSAEESKDITKAQSTAQDMQAKEMQASETQASTKASDSKPSVTPEEELSKIAPAAGGSTASPASTPSK